MKIILLKDVKGVGRKFEEKTVGDGYASNFLIPKKLAVQADSAAAAQIKSLKEGQEKHKAAEDHKLHEEIHKLSGTTINLFENANEQGHLFATVTAEKLSVILKERGVNVPADCILLNHGIKETGTHEVPVRVGSKETRFTLVIERK